MNILLIIIMLSSCIYEKSSKISLNDGVYKLLIDKKFEDEYVKKKIEVDKFVESLKEINDNLDKDISNEFEVNEFSKSLKEFELVLKQDIKFLAGHLREKILSIEVFHENIEINVRSAIKSAIERFYTRSSRVIFLEHILLSKFSPIIFFINNLNYINIFKQQLNKGAIYDAIIDSNFEKLKIEMLKNKKIFIGYLEKVYICIKYGKVFIHLEGFQECEIAYDATNCVLNGASFYLQFSDIISLNLKIIDSVVQLEDIKMELLKI